MTDDELDNVLREDRGSTPPDNGLLAEACRDLLQRIRVLEEKLSPQS